MMTRYSSKSACNKQKPGSFPLRRLALAVMFALAGKAQALPQGGEVVAGDASIGISGGTMDIQQNSQRAILNFQSFDIGSQQTVNFHQPGVDAVALNRVLGGNLSEIHGALNANGQIYLINPSGVLFGNGAQINVGSLVVSTLSISDQDFLAGRDAFSGEGTGTVENRGSINADGRVVLLAPEVINRGEINVPDGDIVLQSSRQALLHTPGSEIPILVEDADLLGRVVNEGTLAAGEVALILESGKGQLAYDAAINNSGLIRAVRATGEGGEIHLLGGAGIVNSGTLDASAETGAGGEITLTAEAINQSGQIAATGSGTGDGGAITLLANNAIAMHSGSAIDASADQVGDSGDVVVIAEKATWLTQDASIKARGGEESGDGGFVEVSGHEYISIDGSVDVGAIKGEGGLWFIDPTDIRIVPNAVGADIGGGFVGGNPNNWAPSPPTTASAQINVLTLWNTINNDGNVRISTASSATGAGNITFDAVLDYNGFGTNNSLTLVADNQIIFTKDGGIWDSNPTGFTDGVTLNFTAGGGLSIADGTDGAGGIVNSGARKIDIQVTTGNALITGLASASSAADAIRLRVLDGEIRDNGDKLWDAKTFNGGGVVLEASAGIENIDLDVAYVDAVSSGGNISLFAGDEDNLPDNLLTVSRLSSANVGAVHSVRELFLSDSAVLGGSNVQISSSVFVAVPLSGLVAPGTLTLLGPDIVTHNSGTPGGRILTLNADGLVINTNAAGGNLQINSNVSTLSLTNGHTNTITVNDVDGLTLGTVAPQVGNIEISSGAGTDLTIGTDITLTGMTGALTLGAGRNLLLNASILDADGPAVNLTAPNSVIFAAGSEVNAGNGNVSIIASAGDVVLGALTGGSLTVNATGSITDANGTGVNLTGTSANLTAGTAIGALDGLETSLSTLQLSAASGGAFLSNSQALTLTSVNVGGDLNISLPTAGNLTLNQSAPAIGGNATFSVAAGQLVVPDGGWTIGGNLTVNAAQGIRDTDSTVSLTAASADFTLGGAAATLNVDFNNLALQVLSGQTVQVVDADDLIVTNLSSTGNLTLSTGGNAHLTVTDTTPVASGQLTLNVGGDLILPDAGLSITGNLTIQADNLRDADTNLTLGAASANISLADGAAAQTWATSFNDLVLSIAGSGTLTLTDTNGLTLTSATTGGSANYRATGANLVLTSVPTATGDLTLGTVGSGNVVIPNAGLVRTGNLTVVADNLVDTDHNLILGANAANITLRDGAAARNWTTGFTSLALNIAGTGAFTLTDSNDLTLTSATTGGNANFTTTNADLVLTATPAVSGTLSLNTSGSGDVVIPNTGLMHGGNLTVSADNLRDSDSILTLGATAANINLRDGATAQTWNTSFASLMLAIAGAGDFTLADTNGLTLTSASTGGSASYTATGADLVLVAAPAAGGNLSLGTNGTGNVVIPDAGLVRSGNLMVVADNLVDTDHNLILGATTANITLRDGAAARSWTTSFNNLVLDIAGTGAFSLTDSNALTLSSASTGGSASFSSTNGDLVLTTMPAVNGDLTLTTIGSGDLVIPAVGLVHSGNLTVIADDLVDGDSTFTLGATNASFNLRGGAAPQTWNTSFQTLALSLAGSGAFTLTDVNGLNLGSVTTGGDATFNATGADLVLTANPTVGGALTLATLGSGDLVIPASGLIHTGALTLSADNLRDTDSSVTLGATTASITLRDGAAAQTWGISFNSLALNIAGAGDLSLTDTNGLTLTSATTGGSATYRATSGDLVLTTVPVAAGHLTLATVGSGDVVIPDAGLVRSGNLTVVADNLRDSDQVLTLGAAAANITLRDGAAARSWSTSFTDLALAIAGTGAFSLTDSNGLTLNTVSIGGDASFSTTGADLVLTAAPVTGGDLTLATLGSGDLVIPAGGLVHTGNLSISADNLSGGDGSLVLGATGATITLRNGNAAQNWSTSFQSLVLAIAGNGDFNITDADGLVLNSVSTGGSASFTAIDADLVLQSAPVVAGDLSLITTGNGDLVMPDAGLSQGGSLTLMAGSIRDTDNTIVLSATDLTADLRDQQAATVWNTSINSLNLNLAGGGALTLTNVGDLSVGSLTSDGAVDLNSTGDLDLLSLDVAQNLALTSGGDLSLADVSLGGDLILVTAPDGTLTIPTVGLVVAGSLDVDAGRVSGGGSWSAGQINLRLRDTIAPTSLDLDAASVSLINDSTADMALQLADGTRLESLSSGGNVQVDGAGDLVLGADTYAVAGELAFTLPGDLTLAAAGLNFSGGLQVTAANLLLAGGGPAILTGAAADLVLSGTRALALDTRLSQLGVSYAGAGPFDLSNDRDLNLTRFDAPAVGRVGLTINGALTIPAGGLAAAERLTLDAVDLSDGDDVLSLSAPQLAVRLSNATAVRSWDLATDELDVLIRGNAGLTVTDADGLTLADLNSDGQAIAVENGNFVLDLTSGDLLVNAHVNAADLTDDDIRSGLIDLNLAAGSLTVQSGVNLVSSNSLDQGASGIAGSYGIRMRLSDTSAANRNITLNDGARLQAVGGDILIDTRPALAVGGRRQFVQNVGALIDAYDNPGDAATGEVLLNGAPVSAAAGQTVRTGRTLAIVSDVVPADLGNPLDQIDDLDDVTKVVDEVEAGGPKAAAQFEQVFGTCDELDQKNRHRCRVDAALKAFLSRWLVGGEMPPRTENP